MGHQNFFYTSGRIKYHGKLLYVRARIWLYRICAMDAWKVILCANCWNVLMREENHIRYAIWDDEQLQNEFPPPFFFSFLLPDWGILHGTGMGSYTEAKLETQLILHCRNFRCTSYGTQAYGKATMPAASRPTGKRSVGWVSSPRSVESRKEFTHVSNLHAPAPSQPKKWWGALRNFNFLPCEWIDNPEVRWKKKKE